MTKTLAIVIISCLTNPMFGQRGLTVSVVPKGDVQILKIEPSRGQVYLKNAPAVKKWLEAVLHISLEKENHCKKYLRALYGKVPRNSNYYFVVETKTSRLNEDFSETICIPVGPGENAVDAYATQLLFPKIMNLPDAQYKTSGHFVKATKDPNGEFIVDLSNEPYDLTLIAAHKLAREKVRKMTLKIPQNEEAIPDHLQHSQFWTQVTQKYSAQLAEQRVLDDVTQLNQEYAKAEASFYNNVKLFFEYQEINSRHAKTAAIIDLSLSLGSTMANVYQTQKLKAEGDQIKANQAAFTQEINILNDHTRQLYQRTEDLRIQHLNLLRNNNIPVNNIPRIPKNIMELEDDLTKLPVFHN